MKRLEEFAYKNSKKFKIANDQLKETKKPSLSLEEPKYKINYDDRLKEQFYNETCLDLSKKLLGKYIIRKLENKEESISYLVSKIVEVEAYLGGNLDPASHSFNNKQTERNKAMFMKAGTAYVYNIYGVYCCLNISANDAGAGVLIRALEPICGLEEMKKNRNGTTNIKNLTNGPSKLCLALNITKDSYNQVDLSNCESMWLQDSLTVESAGVNVENDRPKIVCAKRIGIEGAGQEAVDLLYRFYIKDNKHVSVKSKEETEIV